MFEFPTHNNIEIRGPKAPAWVSDGGEVKFTIPNPGEASLFTGKKEECEKFLISYFYSNIK